MVKSVPEDEYRVLVCGGRDFGNLEYQKRFVLSSLSRLAEEIGEQRMTIIEGGARGADHWAGCWAQSRLTKYGKNRLIVCPADWERYGKRAGYIRNYEMLTKYDPVLVVAFPGGDGTKMMCELAVKHEVPVRKYRIARLRLLR